MKSEDYGEACAAFAESERLDPALGTLLNLAVCHERQGKLASAWVEFRAAASQARHENQTDRATYADEKAATLEPQVPKLTLDIAERARAQGDLQIILDDAVLGRPAWDSPIPLDPGPHHLSARAKGYQAWQMEFALQSGELARAIDVPELQEEPHLQPKPIPARPPQDRPTQGVSTTQWVGIGLTGAGVVGLGAMTYFGLTALSHKKARDDYCDAQNLCSSRGVTLDERARNAATAANITGAVGVGLLGAGVTVLLLTPSARNSPGSVQAAVRETGSQHELWLSGTF
ncbi:MAG TPA: hypothetical protein VL137_01955 [Polyangiaceae bacterium]|nr:hypothetical protein [Polyangiaceae bacterium]